MNEPSEDRAGPWFMAVDGANGTLLVTIEAASVDEAMSRFLAVAPLVGIRPAALRQGLLWIAVSEPIEQLPLFREGYFEAVEALVPSGQTAPGSSALQ